MKEEILKVLRYCPDSGILTRVSTGEIVGASHSKGYLSIYVCGRNYLAHRVAWLISYGDWPNGTIDHVNGIKTDNRILNLRCVSNAENHKNMPLQSNNKNGIPGVHWLDRYGKWRAQIKVSGVIKYLGYHECFFSACCARKSAEIKYGFHANHGRPS